MEKFRIKMIDDEIESLNHLKEICDDYLRKNNIPFEIQIFNNPQTLLQQPLDETNLLLVDIEMPEINGLELATKVREINKKCFICFVTNYADYIYDSYDVHAFDYLLKPINKEKINFMLDEVMKYYVAYSNNNNVKISFSTISEQITISQNSIYYFEYFDKLDNHYSRVTKLYTDSGEYILKQKISEIFQSLPQDIFDIPHKSFIINIEQIKKISQTEIVMQNNAIIPLSQKRSSYLRKKFNNYLTSL